MRPVRELRQHFWHFAVEFNNSIVRSVPSLFLLPPLSPSLFLLPLAVRDLCRSQRLFVHCRIKIYVSCRRTRNSQRDSQRALSYLCGSLPVNLPRAPPSPAIHDCLLHKLVKCFLPFALSLSLPVCLSLSHACRIDSSLHIFASEIMNSFVTAGGKREREREKMPQDTARRRQTKV